MSTHAKPPDPRGPDPARAQRDRPRTPPASPSCSSPTRRGVPARRDDRRPRGDPKLYEQLIEHAPGVRTGGAAADVQIGDLALTATPAKDEAGARAQVARPPPDGSWPRLLDRPDFRG